MIIIKKNRNKTKADPNLLCHSSLEEKVAWSRLGKLSHGHSSLIAFNINCSSNVAWFRCILRWNHQNPLPKQMKKNNICYHEKRNNPNRKIHRQPKLKTKSIEIEIEMSDQVFKNRVEDLDGGDGIWEGRGLGL